MNSAGLSNCTNRNTISRFRDDRWEELASDADCKSHKALG